MGRRGKAAHAAARLDASGRALLTDVVPIRAAAVARARVSLNDARSNLDDAVRCLSGIEGETVMANADLVSLLLSVVTARRHLDDVERGGVPASLR